MIALYVVGGYIVGWLGTYRWQFKRMFRRYRAWQLENPTDVAQWCNEYSYGFNHTPRSQLSFHNWYDVTSESYEFKWHEYPPKYSFAWPVILLFAMCRFTWFRILQPFLQPTGEPKALTTKVNYDQIKKMEKELGIED